MPIGAAQRPVRHTAQPAMADLVQWSKAVGSLALPTRLFRGSADPAFSLFLGPQ